MMFANNIKSKSISSVDLKDTLSKLFTDHVYWTRMFIVSNLADLQDTKDVADRLMKNQRDIGLYIGVFYPTIAQQLTNLFTEHIVITSEIVTGLKNRNDISALRKRWYENADKIHATLFQVNQNINIRPYLYKHLQLTENGISLRLNKNYSQEIINFDAITMQSLDISEYLAKAIIVKSPNMFR